MYMEAESRHYTETTQRELAWFCPCYSSHIKISPAEGASCHCPDQNSCNNSTNSEQQMPSLHSRVLQTEKVLRHYEKTSHWCITAWGVHFPTPTSRNLQPRHRWKTSFYGQGPYKWWLLRRTRPAQGACFNLLRVFRPLYKHNTQEIL